MNVQQLRKDFPSLQEKRNGKPLIYFDNACITLKPKQVIDAMNEYYYKFPACGGHGRSTHLFAQEVQDAVNEAREKIRKFINARKPEKYPEKLQKERSWVPESPGGYEEIREIIWTRNTTEGINLIANCFDLKEGDIVLTTDREHNSNLIPWLELERRKKIRHEVVPSNKDNTFNLEQFEEMMSKKVKLVSMVHTSNLDGYTIPAEEIIKTAHDYGAKVMLDGAQSAPHKKIDVQKLNVDFFAFSIHKMIGPSGMGVLYAKIEELLKLDRFMVGGDTVRDAYYDRVDWLDPPYLYEAGLQNYAGQIGAGGAAEYLMNIGIENISKYEYKLNKYATENLLQHEEIKIIGPEDPKKRAGIINFRVTKNGKTLILPAIVAEKLNKHYNIMIRAGDHCVHSWFNARGIGTSGSARASLYFYNTKSEVEIFISAIAELIEEKI